MHADQGADDELEPRKAHPCVGQGPERERAIRAADVQRDLERERRHGLHVEAAQLEVELPRVDEPGVALGAGDRHLRCLPNCPGCVAGADHRRYSKLAGDDRGVTGPPAAVGHDGGSALHHRLPVGVGHVGDEDVAVAHLLHLRRIQHQPRSARTDALADAPALGQHRAALLELEALDDLSRKAALHRLRAGLEDVDSSVHPVPCPLDVHRPAVVAFDGHRMPGELDDFLVREGEPAPVVERNIDGGDPLRRIVAVDHLQRLAATLAAQDGRTPRFEVGLVHVETRRG